MMGLDGVTGVGRAEARGRREAVRGPAFSVPTERSAAAIAALATAEIGLGGMLALQEAGSEPVRDREARRHGRSMLDELARLQRALLDGAPDAASLRRLAALAEAVPSAENPSLRAALAELALRARVELARHEHVMDC